MIGNAGFARPGARPREHRDESRAIAASLVHA
jgi:hypothetical protein